VAALGNEALYLRCESKREKTHELDRKSTERSRILPLSFTGGYLQGVQAPNFTYPNCVGL